MLVIAHRGANKEALENSWAAFELAIESGAQRLELDLQMTRDGHSVIVHDNSLAHVTGRNLLISELNLSEIKQIKLINGEAIPLLEELIDRLLPRVELNLEIKNCSVPMADLVGRKLLRHPLREKIIVSAFEPEPLIHIAKNFPELKRACLWGDDKLPWPFFSHLAPPNFLTQCATNIFHPRADLVTYNLMDQAKARGWLVYPWSPMIGEEQNRTQQWATLKTLEVDGLCTNYPRELKIWLTEAKRDEYAFSANR